MTGKNVKIALCLSGEARHSMFCFPYIYESLINLPYNYQVDVFIHSWDNFRALDLYNPKKVIIDEDGEYTIPRKYIQNIDFPPEILPIAKTYLNYTPNVNIIYNGLKMLHSIKECFDLSTTYSTYDIIIRSRLDIVFNSPFEIVPILRDILSGKYDIFIPQKLLYHNQPNACSDQLAIGNFKAMDYYSKLIFNLNPLIKETNEWKSETLLFKYLNNSDYKIQTFFVPLYLSRKVKTWTNSQVRKFISL